MIAKRERKETIKEESNRMRRKGIEWKKEGRKIMLRRETVILEERKRRQRMNEHSKVGKKETGRKKIKGG
jgi:hypothetical protein